MEELRQRSEMARNENRRNIRDAIDRSRKEKIRASQEVKSQL
jgi:hypothetical protein